MFSAPGCNPTPTWQPGAGRPWPEPPHPIAMSFPLQQRPIIFMPRALIAAKENRQTPTRQTNTRINPKQQERRSMKTKLLIDLHLRKPGAGCGTAHASPLITNGYFSKQRPAANYLDVDSWFNSYPTAAGQLNNWWWKEPGTARRYLQRHFGDGTRLYVTTPIWALPEH